MDANGASASLCLSLRTDRASADTSHQKRRILLSNVLDAYDEEREYANRDSRSDAVSSMATFHHRSSLRQNRALR